MSRESTVRPSQASTGVPLTLVYLSRSEITALLLAAEHMKLGIVHAFEGRDEVKDLDGAITTLKEATDQWK